MSAFGAKADIEWCCEESPLMTQSGRADEPEIRRTNLRCTYWHSHALEDCDALTTAQRRKRLRRRPETAVDVLPIVHHPHIPSWPMARSVCADVAAGWRNMSAAFYCLNCFQDCSILVMK